MNSQNEAFIIEDYGRKSTFASSGNCRCKGDSKLVLLCKPGTVRIVFWRGK